MLFAGLHCIHRAKTSFFSPRQKHLKSAWTLVHFPRKKLKLDGNTIDTMMSTSKKLFSTSLNDNSFNVGPLKKFMHKTDLEKCNGTMCEKKMGRCCCLGRAIVKKDEKTPMPHNRLMFFFLSTKIKICQIRTFLNVFRRRFCIVSFYIQIKLNMFEMSKGTTVLSSRRPTFSPFAYNV